VTNILCEASDLFAANGIISKEKSLAILPNEIEGKINNPKVH
jgi:hypothetical protein